VVVGTLILNKHETPWVQSRLKGDKSK